MPRGQLQAVNDQIGTINAAAGQQGANAQKVFGFDVPAIQQQISGNLPPGIARGMTQLPQLAAGSAFDAAKQSATSRMARTNNSAGYGELTDKLARDAASAQSKAALQGQEDVGKLQLQQQNEGVKNAGNLFGVSEDTMAKLYGQVPSLLDQRNKVPGWTQGLTNAMGALGTLGIGVSK